MENNDVGHPSRTFTMETDKGSLLVTYREYVNFSMTGLSIEEVYELLRIGGHISKAYTLESFLDAMRRHNTKAVPSREEAPDMETGFGSFMGNQNTISAIVTLAYDCRRPDFFTPHAIAALKLVDSGALSPTSVGAAHGEVGHTQFLPGNVLKYGVGSRNLRDRETALASTANFLRGHGWKAGASYEANMGAIAGWNSASVYQQAIAIMARQIDGD